MDLGLTSGAARALRKGEDIARQAGAFHVEPLHLLWGLLLDESRAAVLLEEQGLTPEQLRVVCPLPSANLPPPRPELPPHGDALQAVLFVGRRVAADLGAGEISSEHLLAGLAEIDTPARTLLAQHGLTPERIGLRSAEHAGVSIEPLPSDETVRCDPPVADRTDLYRILDAAANRAREGLRVLEDFVRFSLDDRHLMTLLKTWRHEFAGSLIAVDGGRLLASRDTDQDVGASVHTLQEFHRGNLLDVVRAAFKRVEEAARSLEEYGKLLDVAFAENVGRLRYELYTLEKAVLRTQSARDRLANRRLYLLLTEELCPNGSGPTIRAALAAGVDIVQVREKHLPDRLLLEHALRVRDWTSQAGALLIVNDRPDLAVLADADGVHVGQDELSVRDARRIVGPDRLVGVSTHTIEHARQAVRDGADYLGVGPVYPSATKEFAQLAGLELVRQVSEEITLPAFAIGGIDSEKIAAVLAAGATRIAVSSAICRARDPGEIARRLRSALA